MSLIANARMYAVAPGAAQAWKRLFAWLAAHSGVDLEAIDHAAPAPLEELWSRSDLGCAFMCGFPFARSQSRPKVVAAPVPSDPRYGGLPVYFTDLVVRADSAFQTLEDTFGKRLGYTVETSHSGFNALRHHLLPFRRDERPKLYAETIGPLVTPRRVIEALLADEIDIGPLDGFALDLVRRHAPALAARLRIVATTDAAPIPLLIASPACPDETGGASDSVSRRLWRGTGVCVLARRIVPVGICARGAGKIREDDRLGSRGHRSRLCYAWMSRPHCLPPDRKRVRRCRRQHRKSHDGQAFLSAAST